jgi:hypothetical protein
MAQISSIKNTSFPSNAKWGNTGQVGGEYFHNPLTEDSNSFAAMLYSDQVKLGHKYDINCRWEPFRAQIMAQWPRITQAELDAAGPNRSYLAMLICTKYGADYRIIKNYLCNFERSLPLA